MESFFSTVKSALGEHFDSHGRFASARHSENLRTSRISGQWSQLSEILARFSLRRASTRGHYNRTSAVGYGTYVEVIQETEFGRLVA